MSEQTLAPTALGTSLDPPVGSFFLACSNPKLCVVNLCSPRQPGSLWGRVPLAGSQENLTVYIFLRSL